MEEHSDDYMAGYLEGMRRVMKEIPKKKWNFKKVKAYLFRNYDEYIDGLNDGFSEGYLKKYEKALGSKYLSDEEKEKLREKITGMMRQNEMEKVEKEIKKEEGEKIKQEAQKKKEEYNTLCEKFDNKKNKHINNISKMNSLEYQIELLEDLKAKLYGLKESIEKIPGKYEGRIEQAKDAGLLGNFINDFNTTYLPQTTDLINGLAQKIENEDIAIIEAIIADLEDLMYIR